MGDGKGAQGDPKGGSGDQVIRVGEKEYTASDVQNLLSQVDSATKKSQTIAAVENFCAKYNLDVPGLLENAEGAFGVVSGLIEDGIIDETGKLKRKEPVKGDDDKNLLDILNLGGDDDNKKLGGLDKVAQIVNKALAPIMEKVDSLGLDVRKTKEMSYSLAEERMKDRIVKAFPELTPEEAGKVIAAAAATKKDVLAVAETMAETKKGFLADVRKKHAEEFGIDLEEFDKTKEREKQRNELGDAGPEGGGIPNLEGKKFSFRKTGEGYVTPLDASKEYFREKLK